MAQYEAPAAISLKDLNKIIDARIEIALAHRAKDGHPERIRALEIVRKWHRRHSEDPKVSDVLGRVAIEIESPRLQMDQEAIEETDRSKLPDDAEIAYRRGDDVDDQFRGMAQREREHELDYD